jgi:hypothetical protein
VGTLAEVRAIGHLERHGDGREGVRDGVAHDEGWPLYLDRYAALLT